MFSFTVSHHSDYNNAECPCTECSYPKRPYAVCHSVHFSSTILSGIILSLVMPSRYAKYHNAECCYTDLLLY